MIYDLLNRYPYLSPVGEGEGGGSGGERAQVKTLEDIYDPLFFVVRGLEKSITELGEDFAALRFPILALVKSIRSFSADAIALQRSFLSFNQSFKTVLNENSKNIAGLPGGLRTSLESVFKFQKEGLFNVGKESLFLANRMTITAQNTDAMIALNKKLIVQGTLDLRATNALNQSTLRTGLKYGVSTDLLVEAMGQLEAGLDVLGLTGGLLPAQDAIKELTGKFPAFGTHITKFVESLVTADIGELAKLDILKDVDKLFAGQMTPEGLEKLVEKAAGGAGKFGTFQGKGKIETEVLMGIVGQTGMIAEQISRGMQQTPARVEVETPTENIWQDFKTSLLTFMAPFAEEVGKTAIGLLNLGTHVLSFIKSIIPVKVVVNALLSFLITSAISRKIRNFRELSAQAANTLATDKNTAALLGTAFKGGAAGVGLGMMGGPVGIAIMAALTFLPMVLSDVGDGLGKIAESEKKKADVELAKIKRDPGGSRFEEFSRLLINEQVRKSQTFNSAMTVSMTRELEKVVDAIDKTTDAVEEKDLEPKVSRT